MNISVFGCGPWGQNIIRTLADLEERYSFSLKNVVHRGDEQRAREVRELVSVEPTTDEHSAIEQSDAVCVATPDDTHPDYVEQILEEDTHVFVEKPIAYGVDRAKQLYELAEERNRVLTVGHLMVFHPAVEYLRENVVEATVEPVDVFMHRFNNLRSGGGRRLLHSSFVHDLSVLDYWFGRRPDGLEIFDADGEAPRFNYLNGTMRWNNDATVRFQCGSNWPARRRSIAIRTDEQFYDFDGIEESIAVFDAPDQRHAEKTETKFDELPLTLELANFVETILGEDTLRVDRDHVLRVTETLEQLQKLASETV